jgi:hypothetical protein
VTGSSYASGYGYATVAYNAATGARLWVKRYGGGGASQQTDGASSVAVSPGGGTVFVTGQSRTDYATVAYKAATGARLWVRRYNGPGNADDSAASVVVSPGGGTVFVTGQSDQEHPQGETDQTSRFATVAYNAATGAPLWVKRYGPFASQAFSAAVSPGGARLYVTGSAVGATTVAYNTTTGAQVWAKNYTPAGGPNSESLALSVAVSPSNGTVFVVGYSNPHVGNSAMDYTTIAYSG